METRIHYLTTWPIPLQLFETKSDRGDYSNEIHNFQAPDDANIVNILRKSKTAASYCYTSYSYK